MQRGLTVEVSLGALRENLKTISNHTGVPVIAVVKADAYGHGMVEVSRALEEEGVYALGVAFLDEAIRLREAGIKAQIIVFFDTELSEEFVEYNLVPVVNATGQIKKLASLARKYSRQIPCHINVDTGMGRTGIWYEEVKDLLSEVLSTKEIKVAGLMSHFSEADLPGSEHTNLQIRRFKDVKKLFHNAGINPVCHMANSWAVINYPESFFDATRVGLILYGGLNPEGLPIKPVMTVKAPILQIRKLPTGIPVS
ncbi:MAG: alanine racemase, partial [Nitrospirae bacterium]